MSSAKAKQALLAARQLAKEKSGLDLYDTFFGSYGRLHDIFRTEAERTEFEGTEEYEAILTFFLTQGIKSAKAQKALLIAQKLAKTTSGIALHDALFGDKGAVDTLFQSNQEKREFETTPEYQEILRLFTTERMNSANATRALLEAQQMAEAKLRPLDLHNRLFNANGESTLFQDEKERKQFEKTPEYQEVLRLPTRDRRWFRPLLRLGGWFKSLVTGTTEGLPQEEWDAVAAQLSYRHDCLQDTMTKINDLGIVDKDKQLTCAVVDMFVEKAQYKLTRRGQMMVIYGNICTVLAIAVLFGAMLVMFWQVGDATKDERELESNRLILVVVKTVTLGGIVGGLAYLLFSLSTRFFHEGTVLLRRRHALRFGRMYVYLKKGDITALEELMNAFQWNTEFTSAFRDIDTKHVSRGPLSQVADAVTAATTAAVAATTKKHD